MRLWKSVVDAACNPVVWVSFLGPTAIYIALALAQSDMLRTGSPAGVASDSIEHIIGLPSTTAILDYALQVNTVVLAFIFWILSLVFTDDVIGVSRRLLHGSDGLGESERTPANKCICYAVTALIVLAILVILFVKSGHLTVIKLYEVTGPQQHHYLLSWFFMIWDFIKGPPVDSPLTWMRVLLVIHASFQSNFLNWKKQLSEQLN